MTKKTRYFMFGSLTVMLVGLCAGLVAYYTGLPMGAFSSSTVPAEFRYVPADATVVAYCDVQQVMKSELRQKLHAVMPEKDLDGQKEFQEATGIDIQNDIDRVVAFMTAGEGDQKSGLVIATGRFDIGRLEALAREHGGTVSDYKGKRLIGKAGDEPGESFSVGFLDTGVVALGQTVMVQRAIDLQEGETILANKELMALVADLDDGNAWAVGRFDALVGQANLPEGVASQIPSVRWFSAAGRVNGGVSGIIRAEARDEQAGQNLRDVVQGFLALAKMQSSSKPELQAIVNSLQLSGTGKTVALSFEVPSQVFDAVAAAAAAKAE